MPDYRQLTITESAPTLADPSAVPLKATKPETVLTTLQAMDTLPGSGGRVRMQWGLHGADAFLVPVDDNPLTAPGARTYPDVDTPRVVARSYGIPVTPGHWLGLDVMAIPSGPTQVNTGTNTFAEDSRGGLLRATVTYWNDDGQSVTATAEVILGASQLLYAAEAANPFGALILKQATAIPMLINADASHWQKWLRGVDVYADVILEEVGSPRIVDAYITERPSAMVVDQTDPRWPSAMFCEGGAPYATLPSDYPIEQLTSTDQGGGANSVRMATLEHGRQLGPVIGVWHSATQHGNTLAEWVDYTATDVPAFGTGDDEAPAYVVTGASEALMDFGAPSGYSAQYPGFLPGHYARQVDHGDDFLDGRTGVIPVWASAYMKTETGSTATVRISSGTPEGWSEIKLTTTSTSWGWVTVAGWLEVGIGPEDALPILRWLANDTAGKDASVRSIVVALRVTDG
jgi:hypothetical protein